MRVHQPITPAGWNLVNLDAEISWEPARECFGLLVSATLRPPEITEIPRRYHVQFLLDPRYHQSIDEFLHIANAHYLQSINSLERTINEFLRIPDDQRFRVTANIVDGCNPFIGQTGKITVPECLKPWQWNFTVRDWKKPEPPKEQELSFS